MAWIGVFLIVTGACRAFTESMRIYSPIFRENPFGPFGEGFNFGFIFALLLGSFGVLIALIDGLIRRPRYLWIGLLTVGSIYISSFFGLYVYRFHLGYILYSLPGLICIVEGVILKCLPRKI